MSKSFLFHFCSLLVSMNVVLTTAVPTPESAASACAGAYENCLFRFDTVENVPHFYLTGVWDDVFTPRIKSKTEGTIVGLMHSNGFEADIVQQGGSRPISSLCGMKKVSKFVFKPFRIPNSPFAGIGSQFLTIRQQNKLKGKCVRLYMSDYQVLNEQHNVQANTGNLRRSDNICVVFMIV